MILMTSDIKNLFEMNISSFLWEVIIFITGIIALFALIEKFSALIGKPVKWIHRNASDHEIVEQISKSLENLQAQHEHDREISDRQDSEIRADLLHLKDMFVDNQIGEMRWRILKFSADLSNGKKFNRESYDYIFRTYTAYEELIELKGQTNGLIDESIRFIRDEYRKELKNKAT